MLHKSACPLSARRRHSQIGVRAGFIRPRAINAYLNCLDNLSDLLSPANRVGNYINVISFGNWGLRGRGGAIWASRVSIAAVAIGVRSYDDYS